MEGKVENSLFNELYIRYFFDGVLSRYANICVFYRKKHTLMKKFHALHIAKSTSKLYYHPFKIKRKIPNRYNPSTSQQPYHRAGMQKLFKLFTRRPRYLFFSPHGMPLESTLRERGCKASLILIFLAPLSLLASHSSKLFMAPKGISAAGRERVD